MDVNEIVKAIFDVPVYIWVILFLVVSFLLRDKSRWKREIDFPVTEGIGRGEVELEYSKRKGGEIEVEMELVDKYQNKPISVFINEALVCTVPAHANNGSGRDYKEPCDLEKPSQGDRVKVVVENETLFSGKFS